MLRSRFRNSHRSCDTDRQPISLNVQFVGPVVSWHHESRPSIIRRGRYLTQGCVSIEQNGKVAVEAQAVFGTERASELKLESKSLTLSKTIEASLPLSESVARNFPNFIQHFECHYTESGFPFSGEGKEILADSAGTDNGPLVTRIGRSFRCLATYTTTDVPQTRRGEHSALACSILR